MPHPSTNVLGHRDYGPALARLSAGFDRRHPGEGDREGRAASAIVASIEGHMRNLGALSPPRDTFGALSALAWFYRCAWGRPDRGGAFFPSYHPEDREGLRRAFRRLSRGERRAVAAEIGGIDPRVALRPGRPRGARPLAFSDMAVRLRAVRKARKRASFHARRERGRSPELAAMFEELVDLHRRVALLEAASL